MTDERIIHYWDGYGNFCMTPEGRRGNAQSSHDVEKVTCHKCRSNLQKIGKLPLPTGNGSP